MSQRAFALPIRTISSRSQLASQWTCRRCLVTQTTSPTNQGDIQHSLNPLTSINPNEDKPDVENLNKTDALLARELPQAKIPVSYLQHSSSTFLHKNEQAQRAETVSHKKIVGVVVSAGKMDKTVKTRVGGQVWNKRIGKYFKTGTNYLTHDPNNSLVEGDVVGLHRLRVSRRVSHVVASIIAPFGTPAEHRPPVPTPDERLAEYKAKRFEKLERRSLRRLAAQGDEEAIDKLADMGLDPGSGAEPGVGKKDNLQPQVGKRRNPGKGAILGEKGQKLPEGVLPGGKHEVGKINRRASQNKKKAREFEAIAGENLLEAKEKGEQLEQEHNISSDSALR